MTATRPLTLLLASLLASCADDGRADATGSAPATVTTDASTSSGTTEAPTTDPSTITPTTDPTTTDPTTDPSTTDPTGTTTASGCDACLDPNETCVDDRCVQSCQGQSPDPCGPDRVCDVISGECHDIDDPCTLSGGTEECDGQRCGPGSVCDGQGACIPIAPCSAVACTADGACWGSACGCERQAACSDPAPELLNGPFAADISAIDFADDCTAWAVTVSGAKESVRRLTSAGELSSFGANSDFDLGEVRVLRQLTIPQLTAPLPLAAEAPPPTPVEGYGEVAVTYICCPSCGSCENNPSARGVARLIEEDPNMPLPIVIPAEPTQGTGPFGVLAVDGGPQGLTWGVDRVLYVGNAKADGAYSSADLEAGTVSDRYTFTGRVSASAPISAVHNLVAVLGGSLYRFNTRTAEVEFVVDLMSDVTNLSHDAFSGHVYASLASLEVVRVHPFTGDVDPFQTMPAKGRVAVSPSGALWFAPVAYINAAPLVSWPLPTTL